MFAMYVSGHYCEEGSHSPARCPSGTYQDEYGQWQCKACPPGYYCDNTMDPVVLYNDTYCPTGYHFSILHCDFLFISLCCVSLLLLIVFH